MQDFDIKLAQWREIKNQVGELAGREMELRKELFAHAFSKPTEGTNTKDLGAGWKLKGIYKISRTIDETALAATREKLAAIGVSLDPLVKFKPELVTSAYRPLSDATRSIFDQCLIIKPGAPMLDLVPPAEKKL